MAFEAMATDDAAEIDEALRRLHLGFEARPVPHRFVELMDLLDEAPWSARELAAA